VKYFPFPPQSFALLTIFSAWVPLLEPIQDAPLTFCDPRTVDPKDLILSKRYTGAYIGELWYLAHNPGQKWYWLSEQKTDEIFVFQTFDTKNEKRKESERKCESSISGSLMQK
jgi:hypothetical protein